MLPSAFSATEWESPAAMATRYEVEIDNFAFVPHGQRIIVGDTITWTNRDAVPHTSTSDNGVWNSGNLVQNQSYSRDREFFGSEWTPGVDQDPHVYVLYVRGVGQSTGGFFSTPDEYNPRVFKYSNGHELFVDSTVPKLLG